MEPAVPVAIFIAACAVGVSAWFLAIFEALGVWRFRAWAFRLGPCILRETQTWIGAPPIQAGETATAKFKFVAPDLCLFRAKYRFAGFRFRTPFPVKGQLRWRGGTVEIQGRVPLFSTVFFTAWLAGWTVGSVMMFLSASDAASIGFGLAGWTFVGALVALSIASELRRFRLMLNELANQLNGMAAG